MSTRSQILFKFEDGQVLTYRHSDGYPIGVIPDLVDFLKWNKRNNQSDYVIPNYFYWVKKEREQYIDGSNNNVPIHKRDLDYNSSVLISYGLDYNGKLHGDIEWFYVVEYYNQTPYDKQVSFRIRCFDVPCNEDYSQKYEYPEQLMKSESPKYTVSIDNIDKFVLDLDEVEKIE